MKNLFCILLFTVISLGSFSQDGRDKPDGSRLEALKIAYLTKKLSLSTEDAQRFWPVYNDYSKEIREARISQRQNNTSELETEEKILGIRKKYNKEFSSALSPERAELFFRSEKEFGNYIRKELAERRQSRQTPSKK